MKGNPSIQSFAVFHKNKMQFETNSNETLGIFWLKQNGLKGRSITFQIKNKIISFRVTSQKSHIKALVKGESPEFHIKIMAKGIMREGEQFFNLKDGRNVHQLEQQIENQIKENIEDILKKNLKNRIDILGFGNYARVCNNLQWENKWKTQWDNMLPGIKTNIEVKFVLEQSGLNINSTGK